MSAFPEFDRSRLALRPLAERRHDMDLSLVRDLSPVAEVPAGLQQTAAKIIMAKKNGAPVIFFMGAHVLRAGVQRYLIDMMENGWITALAGNGACAIHDFELALVGGTTESVARYIQDGSFGFWQETGQINDIIIDAHEKNMGFGEALGRAIVERKLPCRDISVFAAAHRLGVPATVHVGMGCDIIHQHPNCDGAATGAVSYRDFLRFTHAVKNLSGGVVMNFGSAVFGPEVFLKALAMSRNIARQEGGAVTDFTSLVCDIRELPPDYRREASRDSAGYFFRPWKTMLVRTLAGNGQSFYVQGRHEETVPAMWTALSRSLTA